MTDPPTPFELEDEDERAPRSRPAPAPPPEAAPAPGGPPAPERADAEDGERTVDPRTVRERRGEEVPRGDAPVGNPEDWPREAFRYPFLAEGPLLIVASAAPLVLLDILSTSVVARFPAWVLKLVVFVFLLRAQLQLVGASATGRDEPRGWQAALSLTSNEMKRWAAFMGLFLFALVPGWVLILFDWVQPGLLVLGVGSMYVSVLALGSALGDPRLRRPWHAVVWMVRWPLPCVVGSLGWWVLGLSEYAIARSFDESVALVVFQSLVLRLVDGYALAFSARILGVLGRRWKP